MQLQGHRIICADVPGQYHGPPLHVLLLARCRPLFEAVSWPNDCPRRANVLCYQMLIGSVDQIVETLLDRRRRFGISYIQIAEMHLETLAPIIARVAGK